MKVWKGGLTGGDIAVGYLVKPNTMSNLVEVECTVHYNGSTVMNRVVFTKELLMSVPDPVEMIEHRVEMTIMHSVSEIITMHCDVPALCTKIVDVAAGGGIDEDNELAYAADWMPDQPVWTGTAVVTELVESCPGLKEIVAYPRHLDPEADWPPQEDDELRFVIINLNDRLGWSFDQIAEWLETLDIDINIDLSEPEGGES